MSIIISKHGEDTQKLERSDFEKEDYLQNYIHRNPESIPVYEIEEDKKLFVVKREFATNAGPIDALAVDKDGDIYIIETKLYKNPDKRTVVAQALDYGSALWRHLNDFDDFIRILNQETQKNFNVDFQEKMEEFFNIDSETFLFTITNLKKNLNEGNIKFVILMDAIEERLKDLIVYVNQNSQFDIYAVQLEYYKFNDYEIMIPKMFGVEVKKNIKSSGSSLRRQWDEQSFMNKVREELKGQAGKVIDMYNYFKNTADEINWGTGSVNGSFSPVFNKINENISLFTFYTNGDIMIKFSWLKKYIAEDVLNGYIDTFHNELKQRAGIDISIDDLRNKEPKIAAIDFFENYEEVKEVLVTFPDKFGE